MMIESTIVRVHRHSVGARKKGRGSGHRPIPGGLTTNIHVTVDAVGKAVAFSLTPRQRTDITEGRTASG